MLTATRLISAIGFGAVGYVIFMIIVAVLNEDKIPSFLMPVCVGAGLWMGWLICGKNTHGVKSGIGNGYTAVVAQCVLIVFAISFEVVLERSMRLRYDGPGEALVDMFAQMFENIMKFATPEMGIVVACGGFIVGGIAGLVARRFGN